MNTETVCLTFFIGFFSGFGLMLMLAIWLKDNAEVEEAYYKGVEAGLEVGDKTHEELIASIAEKQECILMLREERNQLREALTTGGRK